MMRAFWALLLLPGALKAGTLRWDALPAKVGAAPLAQAYELGARAALRRQSPLAHSFSPQLSAFAQGLAEASEPGSSQAWPEVGLTAQVNLWRGGRDQAGLSALRLEAKAAQAEAREARQELLLKARQTWLEAWSARRRLAALRAALQRCQEDLKRVRQQQAAGLLPRSDVLALEMYLAELDQHAFEEGHLADEAEHHLAALLGLPASAAEDLTDESAFDWPSAQALQGSKRPAQAGLEAMAEALRQQQKAVGRLFEPSLDLSGQARAGRAGLGLDSARDLQALVTLNLEFDAASGKGSERAWLLGLSQAKQKEFEAQQKADEVEREELGHALSSWVGRRPAIEARLAASLEFRQAVLDENKRGVRDSRDLLESNAAQLEAEADLIVAKVRAWGVWAELEGFE